MSALNRPQIIELAQLRRQRLAELADKPCIKAACSDTRPCPPCKALEGVILDAIARRRRA